MRAGARKIKRILDDQDRSWMKYKECDLCGESIVINNYPDHRPRTPKVLKRVCCPWCEDRNGKRRMAEKIIVERLADIDPYSITLFEELDKLTDLAKRVQEM